MNAKLVSLAGCMVSAGSITNRKRMVARSVTPWYIRRAMRRLLSRTLPALLAGVVTLGLVLGLPDPGAAAPLSGARAGAATESRLASETALAVLKRGGDAVDAAVAAAIAAGVVAPTSSGLGAGGFALVYRASDKSVVALDFREAAPAALDAGAFERRPLPDDERGKLVGVPTEVRGLA